VICDFDFKSFFDWFWIWFDVFGKKTTLQYISFVTVDLRQFTSMPDFSQTFRVLHFNSLPQLSRKMRTTDMILQLSWAADCCWWITPSCSCKSCQSGSTELPWWQRKGLADPFWLSQCLCNVFEVQYSFAELGTSRAPFQHWRVNCNASQKQVVWWCFWTTANVEDKCRHLKWNFDEWLEQGRLHHINDRANAPWKK